MTDAGVRGHGDAQPSRPGAQGPGTAAGTSGPDAGQSPYPSAGGDYSYSDDDWGPPRDEDAPPLDEEPPMDWVPATPSGNRATPPPPEVGGSQEPSGSRGDAAARPREAATSGSTPDTVAQPGSTDAGPAHDPWTRAVEQAPGVWVVGDKSNVGANPAPGSVPDNIGTQADVPHYAPATAQVPPSIPVSPAAAAPAPVAAAGWGSGTSTGSIAGSAPGAVSGPGRGAPAAGSYPAQSPASAPAPEFAMASAAAAPVAKAAVAPSRPQPAAAAPVAGRTETRQSLYQRLSNSPEAEAGRAKAPARAASAPSAYVQDVPSADDETIEESGVFGRAAVERILGGKLIEERSLDGSPVTPRY